MSSWLVSFLLCSRSRDKNFRLNLFYFGNFSGCFLDSFQISPQMLRIVIRQHSVTKIGDVIFDTELFDHLSGPSCNSLRLSVQQPRISIALLLQSELPVEPC